MLPSRSPREALTVVYRLRLFSAAPAEGWPHVTSGLPNQCIGKCSPFVDDTVEMRWRYCCDGYGLLWVWLYASRASVRGACQYP
jgi:hypothetical protein